jgi:hypothetical protein
MEKILRLLGHKVRHDVFGVEGIVTSVSFDLNGCIQAAVRPQGIDKQGKLLESYGWFDVKGLKVLSKTPFQEQPDFCVVPGGTDLMKPYK